MSLLQKQIIELWYLKCWVFGGNTIYTVEEPAWPSSYRHSTGEDMPTGDTFIQISVHLNRTPCMMQHFMVESTIRKWSLFTAGGWGGGNLKITCTQNLPSPPRILCTEILPLSPMVVMSALHIMAKWSITFHWYICKSSVFVLNIICYTSGGENFLRVFSTVSVVMDTLCTEFRADISVTSNHIIIQLHTVSICTVGASGEPSISVHWNFAPLHFHALKFLSPPLICTARQPWIMKAP